MLKSTVNQIILDKITKIKFSLKDTRHCLTQPFQLNSATSACNTVMVYLDSTSPN